MLAGRSPRSRRLLHLVLPLLSLGGCVVPVTGSAPTSTIIAADSSADHRALLAAAWADQVAFEEFRLQNLPRLFGPFSERPRCPEPLGRFCLYPGDAYGAWKHIPEPPEIALRRAELISALREIARRIPADDWVAGQLVRYAVEAGMFDEARQAVEKCVGTAWWCTALLGYTLHRSGDAKGAEVAFAVSLGNMEPAERQRWLDPALLLQPSDADSLRRMSGAERLRFTQWFWRLADPFLSLPGNEVQSEHFSRRVEMQFQWAAGHLDGLPWGEDLDQVLLRYGMPTHRLRGMGAEFDFMWKRYYVGPPFGVADLLSHYEMPALEVLPPTEGMRPGRGTWDRVEPWPRAAYPLAAGDSLATWLPPLSHQVAVFRRGAAALVAAAFDPTGHDMPSETRADAGLVLVPWDDPIPELIGVRAENVAGPGHLLLFAEPRPSLLSLEVMLPEVGRWSRARRELDIRPFTPGEIGISDVLLTRGDQPSPDSLADALPLARGSNRVLPGEAIGVFWEMYGLDPERYSQVTMSLRILAEETGALRRLGQVFGLLPDDNPTRISWEEEALPGEWMARSIVLVVPDLPGGAHTLELTMQVGDLEPFVVRKEIVVGSPTIRELPRGAMTRRPLLRRTLCGALADEMVIGNLENAAISQAFRESEAFRELWVESWLDRPIDIPPTQDCFDWVRMRPDYFGHGAQDR